MQLTKFSKLKIIHTPGKNLTVADMLSRTFTKEQLQIHQLRHKQLPPQINFSILKDDQYKPVQFSIRINNKGEDILIKPLDSFSFQSIVAFESKYKRPTKIKQNHFYNNQLSLTTLIILVMKMKPINHKI